jgi:hypothetical protein
MHLINLSGTWARDYNRAVKVCLMSGISLFNAFNNSLGNWARVKDWIMDLI